jgi:hypothetical protein
MFLRELTKQNGIAANGGDTSSVKLKGLMVQVQQEDEDKKVVAKKVTQPKKTLDKKVAEKKSTEKKEAVEKKEVQKKEVANKDVDEIMQDGDWVVSTM